MSIKLVRHGRFFIVTRPTTGVQWVWRSLPRALQFCLNWHCKND
jgi:hypothetical protein